MKDIIELLRDRIDYEENCDHDGVPDIEQMMFINGMKYALEIITSPEKFR